MTPFKTLVFYIGIDSFQDLPAVTISAKRQKLTPFKTLVFYIGIDSFQDPCSDSAKCQKLTSSKLTPFKTPGKILDSFQDPYVLHFGLLSRPQPFFNTSRLISGPPAVNCLKHNPIQSFQDPQIGFITVFQSPWETTCKISMGDYLHDKLFKTLYTVNFGLFHENKGGRHITYK